MVSPAAWTRDGLHIVNAWSPADPSSPAGKAALSEIKAAAAVVPGVPVTDVKILSTGLAAGIIIDATVIRGVLAPALVALLGRANWWLPRPATRLLRATPLTTGAAPRAPASPGGVRPASAGNADIMAGRGRRKHGG